jgi:SAM-dependent methyltransferase
MDHLSTGQVTKSAAEIYEEFFVPALFQEWVKPVADAARLGSGQRVLDVACGTGVLAREAATRIAPSGAVVGLDRNGGMLAVARRIAPAIEWREGRSEAMPFPDAEFDAVVSQFGLMFFEDRVTALKEMWRVLRPGGLLVVAVWDRLERSPGYDAMVTLLQRLFGSRVADELRAPFALGATEVLNGLFAEAGIGGIAIGNLRKSARFPSIDSWVHTDVRGWTLADLIDDAQYQKLLETAREELSNFVQPDGTVAFEAGAHIVTAGKG